MSATSGPRGFAAAMSDGQPKQAGRPGPEKDPPPAMRGDGKSDKRAYKVAVCGGRRDFRGRRYCHWRSRVTRT